METIIVNGVETVSEDDIVNIYPKLVPSKRLLVKLLAQQGYRFASNNNRYMHTTKKWAPFNIFLVANSRHKEARYLWALMPREVQHDLAV